MFALKLAVENHPNPVFPNAMIAGDCVITHLLGRLGYLKDGKVTAEKHATESAWARILALQLVCTGEAASLFRSPRAK